MWVQKTKNVFVSFWSPAVYVEITKFVMPVKRFVHKRL